MIVKSRLNQAEEINYFSTFARLWACATLIHQLAFTFWAMAWPGWVLVFTAIAVVVQPVCLFRFTCLVGASLVNLFHKLPFVPNHILFEGMLHVIIALGIVGYLVKNRGWTFLRKAFDTGWKAKFLLTVVVVKTLYHTLPFIEENKILGVITTACLIYAICINLFGRGPVRSTGTPLAAFAPVVRIAIIMMYFWAVIQKLNYDYFNPEISCAAQLHIEIAHYFGNLIPIDRWALHAAIWGSLLFEFAIPVLLFIRRTRLVGFVAAVWFHLWLAIHPAAGIYSFSSLILAVLFLFLPIGFWRSLRELFHRQTVWLGRGDINKGTKRVCTLIIATFFAILITQITLYLTQGRSMDTFSWANRLGFSGFVIWGLWLGSCYVAAAISGWKKENLFAHRPMTTIAWLGLLVVFYNGASPWLGGKTQTSFSMYSNLKSEGEGNHFFLKRFDLLPFQKDMAKVVKVEPNIFDPSNRPKGIANFANPGHLVMPFFELRRIVSSAPGDISIVYEHRGELKTASRHGETLTGEAGIFQPLPVLARKTFWFRRLDKVEGPMPCTH